MIARNEFTDLIQDFVLLLEKQLEGFSRDNIVRLMEVLNGSSDENMPAIFLGDNKLLNFRYMDGHTEVITAEKVMDILDYEEFKKTRTIILRKAS